MRVALFHNLPSGGAKRHTAEQVRLLAERGHHIVEFAPSTADVDFCSLAPYVVEQRVFPAGLPVIRTGRIPLVSPYLHALDGLSILRRTASVNRSIAREIDNANFDLAFVKDCHLAMNPYILRYLHTPSVFQCHHGLRHHVEEYVGEQRAQRSVGAHLKSIYYAPARAAYHMRFARDEKRNVRSASRVLTNSQFSRSLIEAEYGVRASIVYPGINTSTFFPSGDPKLDYVLCVGGLIYSKGYRFLVSALGRIPARRRPRLLIVANTVDPAEAQTIADQAQQLGVELHVETITDDARLRQVYSQALAFIYAPLQEALGMAPLEALSCGTPVVAVAEGGIKETIRDGVTGWTVNRDEQAFADRLDALLSDGATRAAMSQNGQSYVRETWTWQAAIDRLEGHLEAVRRTA